MTQYALGGCGINVICEENGVALSLVDMGIIGVFDNSRIINRKLMSGKKTLRGCP